MGFRASSLEEVGDIMIEAFGKRKRRIIEELFDNLMETTPEKTGTLKANWFVKAGKGAGRFVIENNGLDAIEPETPDFSQYERDWKTFTLYNNSPYIVIVNNGEGGNQHNQNFIQAAMEMTKNA